MATVGTSGTKFHIGSTAVCDTLAEFAAVTYTQVKGLLAVGELGGTVEVGTVDRIDTGDRSKFKTVTDYDEPEFEFEYIAGDAGQAAMEAAYAANSVYNFKVVFSDGRAVYFRALVMSARIVTGGISDVVKAVYSLARVEIDNVASV